MYIRTFTNSLTSQAGHAIEYASPLDCYNVSVVWGKNGKAQDFTRAYKISQANRQVYYCDPCIRLPALEK